MTHTFVRDDYLTSCHRFRLGLLLPIAILFQVACTGESKQPPQEPPADAQAGRVGEESPQPDKLPMPTTEEELQKALEATNPGYEGNGQFLFEEGKLVAAALPRARVRDLSPLSGQPLRILDAMQTRVQDLEPLRGMPLAELYLDDTPIKDIAPLEGMPLRKLYLFKTRVKDLSPLRGAPLSDLNLVGTRIDDLSPLERSPLRMLWLTETPVSDISPLRGLPLVSLTLHRTQVKDLGPLADSALERLHIGETPVTNLTPLRNLALTRLVFSPARITEGLDAVRQMSSLREIGLRFDDEANTLMPPAVFWSRYDAGTLTPD